VRGLWDGVLQGGCRRGRVRGVSCCLHAIDGLGGDLVLLQRGLPENGAENGACGACPAGTFKDEVDNTSEPGAGCALAHGCCTCGANETTLVRLRCTRTRVCACRGMPAEAARRVESASTRRRRATRRARPAQQAPRLSQRPSAINRSVWQTAYEGFRARTLRSKYRPGARVGRQVERRVGLRGAVGSEASRGAIQASITTYNGNPLVSSRRAQGMRTGGPGQQTGFGRGKRPKGTEFILSEKKIVSANIFNQVTYISLNSCHVIAVLSVEDVQMQFSSSFLIVVSERTNKSHHHHIPQIQS
jgi:hypothetical protein